MSGSLPLVSIIIPCFNAERLVGDAIRSALAQTYPHREVIVIDDGSTDGSLGVIQSFGDAVRWETGPNRGGCAARNRGLALANGEFVQFLDADDLLLPRKLEVGIHQLLAERTDVCLLPFRTVKPHSPAIVSGVTRVPAGDPVVWLLSADVRLPPLYRARTLSSVGGFDTSLPCCQDFDLNLRVAFHGASYSSVSEIGYEIRRQAASVSSDEVRLYRVMAQVLRRFDLALDASAPQSEVRKRHLAAKMASCGRWLLRLGDVAGGLEAFKAAGSVHPSGGLVSSYSPPALLLRQIAGPVWAERALWRLRSWWPDTRKRLAGLVAHR